MTQAEALQRSPTYPARAADRRRLAPIAATVAATATHGIRLTLQADGDIVQQASVDTDALFQRSAAELVGHSLEEILPGHAGWIRQIIATLSDEEDRRILVRLPSGTIDGVLRRHGRFVSIGLHTGPVAGLGAPDRHPIDRRGLDDDQSSLVAERLAQATVGTTTSRRLAGLLARRIAEATGFGHVMVTRATGTATEAEEIIADHSLVRPKPSGVHSGTPHRHAPRQATARQAGDTGTTLACSINAGGQPWGRLLCHDDRPRTLPWDLWEHLTTVVQDAGERIAVLEAKERGRDGGSTRDRSSGTAFAGTVPATSGRVLLVEDARTHRAVACAALRKAGFNVAVAPNGATAAQIALGGDVDLLMIDVELSTDEAIATVQRLRADHRTLALPVIALTALGGRAVAADLLQAGMDDHIAKPFNAAKLAATAQRWVETFRERRAAAGDHSNDAGPARSPATPVSPLTEFLVGAAPILERIVQDASPLGDQANGVEANGVEADGVEAGAVEAGQAPRGPDAAPLDRVRDLARELDEARQANRVDQLAPLSAELGRAWQPVAESIATVIRSVTRTPS